VATAAGVVAVAALIGAAFMVVGFVEVSRAEIGTAVVPAGVGAGAANNSLTPLGGRAGSGAANGGNVTPEGRPLGHVA
jgi:hypothetical protein